MEREVAKFLGLIKGGVYVNSLEVANGVNSANNTYAGKWAGKKYSAVPDSLIQLKSSDIKAYYNSHKNMFKQNAVACAFVCRVRGSPTDDDMLALEKSVAEVGAQFAATEELKSFVRANRNGKIADNYVSAKQLSEEEAQGPARRRHLRSRTEEQRVDDGPRAGYQDRSRLDGHPPHRTSLYAGGAGRQSADRAQGRCRLRSGRCAVFGL